MLRRVGGSLLRALSGKSRLQQLRQSVKAMVLLSCWNGQISQSIQEMFQVGQALCLPVGALRDDIRIKWC